MNMEPIMITGTQVELFRLMAMKSALKLECLGMKHSRGSVYALIKREFGYKGSKKKVLEQFSAMIEELKK